MGIDNVNDLEPRVQYVASAGQDEFDYTFPIFDDNGLKVAVNGTLVVSGYTVDGVGDDLGGTVTFDTGLDEDDVVTLWRETVQERLTDFAQNGGFVAANFNDEFDRYLLMIQELDERFGRVLISPITAETPIFDENTFDPIGPWLGKYLFINSQGVLVPADGSSMAQILTTDGDLLTVSGGQLARLPIGSSNQVLKVVAGEPDWVDGGSNGGSGLSRPVVSAQFVGGAGGSSGASALSFLPDYQMRGFVYSHAVNSGSSIGGYDQSLGIDAQATTSHPALDGTDTVIKSKPRMRQTTAAAVDSSAGFKAPNASGIFWNASAAAQGGGFDLLFVGGFPTVRADQTIFIGYDATQSFTSFDDGVYSTKVNIIAFAKDDTDANLQIMYNDGSGTATKVDTGIVATTLANKLLRFRLYSDGVSIGYELYNAETDAVLVTGSVSGANLPAADVALMWKLIAGTGGSTGTAVALDWLRVIEIQPDRADQITV